MFDKNRKKLIAQRLKEQRKKNKLTHIGLANALNEKYGLGISKDSLIQYEVIDEFHAKWDKVKGMKIEYLYYFADFFNVSTDYLLGKDECTTPENEAIKKQLGLSDIAIGQLKTANTNKLKDLQYKKIAMINYLTENMNSEEQNLLENLYKYIFFNYSFPIHGDNERCTLATEIAQIGIDGKPLFTYLNSYEISGIYLSKIQEDTVMMKKEYNNAYREVAKDGEPE